MLTVNVPTLVLWAMDDAALPPELVDGLDDYVPQLTLEKVDGASHWIVHERPQFVAQRLAHFLSAAAGLKAQYTGGSPGGRVLKRLCTQ